MQLNDDGARISDTLFPPSSPSSPLSPLSPPHEEYQYLDLLEHILENGTWEDGRNGRTKAVFGASMRFSLCNGTLPLMTTKRVAWKTCLKELLWFIRGNTDNRILKEQGVHIWDANGTREFLDSRGLQHYAEDELGPIYGWQWRSFNQPYVPLHSSGAPATGVGVDQPHDVRQVSASATGVDQPRITRQVSAVGVDQLQQIIDALKDPAQRTSRRLVMSAWNPCQLPEMALPPCHVLCQFNVHDGNKLSCAMYQRSNDEALGTCFNIASYSFLTHLLAKHCGLEAHEFVYFKGNCHLYEDHLDGIRTQLARDPLPFPTVSIRQLRDRIEDYQLDDFEVQHYQHHPSIPFKMVA
jgi:thymidylate synthase